MKNFSHVLRSIEHRSGADTGSTQNAGLSGNPSMPHEDYRPQSSTRRGNTPHLRRFLTTFFRTALDEYREAGCPFGKNVDAMLIWFEYNQKTTEN